MKIFNKVIVAALVMLPFCASAGDLMSERKWAEPKALFGSDKKLVAEIVAMEKAVEKNYNEEFLKDPDNPLQYYADSEDIIFTDILSPGEYFGDDVRKWFNFIGPKFVGDLWLKNMQVYAKGTTGFIYMNQIYKIPGPNGESIFWVMRQTDVVEKIKGKWKILHTHLSFAADPKQLDPSTWVLDYDVDQREKPWVTGYGDCDPACLLKGAGQ
jgi:ketosteroid isomerase-like protein